MGSKELLEPKQSKKDEEVKIPTLLPQTQTKEQELFGIPINNIKDGLVLASIAFTGIIGAKVFIVDPYIAMVQRQNEQAAMEAQMQQQKQQQQQQGKGFKVIDNNLLNKPINPQQFGQLNIRSVDNTDTARSSVVSNDVRPSPTSFGNFREIDNTVSSNPYQQNRFIVPETKKQPQIVMRQPMSTASRPMAAGQQSGGQWPTAKSWPAHTHPSSNSVSAVESRSGSYEGEEERDTGAAAISAAPEQQQQQNAQQRQSQQPQKQQQPSVLEQQIAGDADNYYYYSNG